MIVLIVASYAKSLVNFRRDLICDLLAAGCEVHAAAPMLTSTSPVTKELESLGVIVADFPLARTGINPFEDLRSLFVLWKLCRRIKPNHILSYTIKPVIYGSVAAFLSFVPNRVALITGLGYTFQGESGTGARGSVGMIAQLLYRVALFCSNLTFFQNPDDLELFRARNIVRKSAKVCVVNGSGIDVESFGVVSLPLALNVRFLLIARLLGDKGVREYISAARLIKSRFPGVQFDLVGWIDDNPDAISQVELDAWCYEGIVNYLGKLHDVRPAIEKCCVYVLPSYREGTPRTVLEAMAMGRPIITTDAPGCRETVIDGSNGFLVPIKSVDALVSAMEKFVCQPSLIAEMGKRSREMAVEKYDVHKVNAIMLKQMGIR